MVLARGLEEYLHAAADDLVAWELHGSHIFLWVREPGQVQGLLEVSVEVYGLLQGTIRAFSLGLWRLRLQGSRGPVLTGVRGDPWRAMLRRLRSASWKARSLRASGLRRSEVMGTLGL